MYLNTNPHPTPYVHNILILPNTLAIQLRQVVKAAGEFMRRCSWELQTRCYDARQSFSCFKDDLRCRMGKGGLCVLAPKLNGAGDEAE